MPARGEGRSRTPVVGGVAFDQDQRLLRASASRSACRISALPTPRPLVRRKDRERTELQDGMCAGLDLDVAQQHVPDELAAVFRDERKLGDKSVRCANRVDEIGFDRPAERLFVDLPDGGRSVPLGRGSSRGAQQGGLGEQRAERLGLERMTLGPPSSISSSSKIACAWGRAIGAATAFAATVHLVETIVGVEDAAHESCGETFRSSGSPAAGKPRRNGPRDGSGRASCPDRMQSHLPHRVRRVALGSANAFPHRPSRAHPARTPARAA